MLTPQEVQGRVKEIESYLSVRHLAGVTQLVLASADGKTAHQVRMPNEVWLYFLKRQIEALPADTPNHNCTETPFPADPDYTGDADQPLFPNCPAQQPPAASPGETPKPSPLPGDEGTGEKP